MSVLITLETLHTSYLISFSSCLQELVSGKETKVDFSHGVRALIFPFGMWNFPATIIML